MPPDQMHDSSDVIPERQDDDLAWAGEEKGSRANVGNSERAVSVAAGSILALFGLSRKSVPGLITALVGGAMIYRGASGHCHMYDALGIDTAEDEPQGMSEQDILRNGIHIEHSFLINKPADELYQYWRNFENLPNFMTYLQSVRVEGNRSHWVAKAPRIIGGQVEWDAEITRDEPNSVIAWTSLPGSGIDTAGEIRFEKAPGDRGTMAHVTMAYRPPAGKLGHWITSMLGENPKRVVREDLRNFKRIMELGELVTIIGQSHGTCTGQGEYLSESDWKPLHM